MVNTFKNLTKIIINNKYLKLLLIQLAILLVLVFIFVFANSPLVDIAPSCFWQENYGFNCPSCGATRCVTNFINGNFSLAFSYNPFLFILIVYLFLLDLLYIINTILNKKYLRFFYPKWWYVIIYFSLWAIYTIIINVLNFI